MRARASARAASTRRPDLVDDDPDRAAGPPPGSSPIPRIRPDSAPPLRPRYCRSSSSRAARSGAAAILREGLVAEVAQLAGEGGEVHGGERRLQDAGPGITDPRGAGAREGPAAVDRAGLGPAVPSGAAGDLDDASERRVVADRDVGEDLAVEGDVGPLEAAHELAVGQAVGAGRGVDPDDP